MTTTVQQNRTATRIGVSIHAEDPITAAGIATLLRNDPAVAVLQPGPDQRPQVAIVAIGPSGPDGIEPLRRPAMRGVSIVLVVDALPEAELETLTSRIRVGAVVPRWTASKQALLDAIAQAATRRRSLSPSTISALLTGAQQRPGGAFEPPLSIRETAVLTLIADGCTSADAAERLGCSARTVKDIMGAVTARPGIRNRTHAVAIAIRDDLL